MRPGGKHHLARCETARSHRRTGSLAGTRAGEEATYSSRTSTSPWSRILRKMVRAGWRVARPREGLWESLMWIDRAVKWLLPREEHFFDMLERGAARAHEISALLVECCAAGSRADRESIIERMHQVEHEADRVIAEVYEALSRTFVTPLDRSDIYALAVSLEEVADAVFAT